MHFTKLYTFAQLEIAQLSLMIELGDLNLFEYSRRNLIEGIMISSLWNY